MDIKEKAKATLENRIQKVERLIAEKGVGYSYLSRAQKVQRNINLAIFAGGIVAIAGLTIWALRNNKSNGEES
jgi:ABC-type transport system involved in cytochrome bd biosynthesis fused ATPase/permease subunit